ncbi:MAG TPA: sensor histidine kinase [Streptosporangiaceae bacterium]|jgi:signal transduction histidine kinase|nr:sensor histidine kinase [Streptosporangiaceae bacterium]
MTKLVEAAAPPGGSRRQWVIDAAIALGITAAQLGALHASRSWASTPQPAPAWDVYLLLAIAGLALIARRRFPVEVLAVSLGTTLAAGKLGHGGMTWIALIAAFLSAELAGKRAAAAASLIIGYLSVVWPPWQIGQSGHISPGAALGVAAWLLVLLAAAELIRSRGQRAAALRRSREDEYRRRASEDRVRIARDLHDVLAHNISVINVQANTALHLMDRQPDRAKEALTAIHGVSRQALAELRAVLGVLRDGDQADGGAPRTPSPGLARLADLLSSVRFAGLDAQLSVEGEARPLPAPADIAAYRIVQEALTNTARHSAATSVTVCVRYEPAGVELLVTDAGPALVAAAIVAGPPAVSPGHGITGMAERVRELGGTFEAGPQPAGGFRVLAWLPGGDAAGTGADS